MTLDQLPEDFTPEQFMQLDKESLDKIPYQRMKWICQIKGCKGGTHVRDYGISPWYFLDRNSKSAALYPTEYWKNLDLRFTLCSRHYKPYMRLVKLYGEERVYSKLIDLSAMPIERLQPAGGQKIKADESFTDEKRVKNSQK